MSDRNKKLNKILDFVLLEAVQEHYDVAKYYCLGCDARPISSFINKASDLVHDTDCPLLLAREFIKDMEDSK